MTLKKTILGLTLAVIGFSGLSQAQAKSPYPYSLKNYDKPSKGCYPVSRVSLTEARDIIRLQKRNFTLRSKYY